MSGAKAVGERANAVAWTEIPVTDMDRARAFYADVLQAELTIEEGGPNPMAMLPYAGGVGVSGHLYPGKPAPEGSGSTVHLAVPEAIERTMERVRTAGGQVVSEAITISAGRFFYALDPDGNSIGFFES